MAQKRTATSVDKQVGANIRKIRTSKRISLYSLAEELGISHQQMQKYEVGTNRISAGMLWQIAKTLNVKLMHLFADVE